MWLNKVLKSLKFRNPEPVEALSILSDYISLTVAVLWWVLFSFPVNMTMDTDMAMATVDQQERLFITMMVMEMEDMVSLNYWDVKLIYFFLFY